jgi:hypothetical protein
VNRFWQIVTALLGIGSFALTAKVSKDADRNQREIELHQAMHENERLRAGIQLDRVRSMMSEALQPLSICFVHSMESGIEMVHELQLSNTLSKCGITNAWVKPFPLWPHVELKLPSEMVSGMMTSASGGCHQLGPADLAVSEADPPVRLEWYSEVQADIMMPLQQEFTAIFRRTRHLIDPPEESDAFMQQMYAMNGLDAKKAHIGNYMNLLNEYCAYCDAWKPIVKRFARGDYSIMQPTLANCGFFAWAVVVSMI